MILDIAFILLLVSIAFVGYKIGFITSFIKMASMIGGLIIASLFTNPVTNWICESGIDDPISNNIYENVTSADAFQQYYANGGGEEGISAILTELGIPEFLSDFVAHEFIANVNAEEAAMAISEGLSRAVVSAATFIVLLICSSLLFFILKLVIKLLRKAIGLFRVFDGLLGMVFYMILLLFFSYIGLMVVSLVMQSLPADHGFVMFMHEQLKLDSDDFGIVKYLYENNFIGNIIKLFI